MTKCRLWHSSSVTHYRAAHSTLCSLCLTAPLQENFHGFALLFSLHLHSFLLSVHWVGRGSEGEQVLYQSEGWWFSPCLFQSACRGVQASEKLLLVAVTLMCECVCVSLWWAVWKSVECVMWMDDCWPACKSTLSIERLEQRFSKMHLSTFSLCHFFDILNYKL